MDDDKPGDHIDETSPLPPGGNRNRPGPTIELKATDVSDAGAAPQTGSAAGGETSSRWRPRLERVSGLFSSFVSSLLVPAITGAAVAALVAGGIVFFAGRSGDTSSSPAPASASMEALNARIAALESKGGGSGQMSFSQWADTNPALAAKFNAIDEALAALRDKARKLREQNEATVASIDAVKSAIPEPVAAPDLSGIEERLAKLERATVALNADAPAARAVAMPADPTVPRVAAAALLDQIVHRGEPFEAALGNVRKFGDTGALKPLEPFAATGVPSANALSGELLALLPQLQPNDDAAPATGSILQRLQQSASRLVRIRRADDAQTGDVLSRVQDAAQREDIAEARRLLLLLPDTQRAKAQQWIDRADARDAALAASSRYAQDAMSVLPRQSGDTR